ncbi:phosphatidylinositol-glycan biosynthesis class W protein-like [Cydia splendana]|uniref:phosphatidylinositol-glycan biosynthesis class W protein-like n=1 Tax=Cydia splendana TaxID=1100963 RepID=UPI00214712BD
MAQLSISEVEMLNNVEYKQYHESFMQNNHGSTAFHTCFSIFFTIQCSLYCCVAHRRAGWQQYLFEFSVIVLPLIAVHTVLADYLLHLNLIVFFLLVLEYVKNYSKIYIVKSFRKLNSFGTQYLHLVSIIRALTYLITAFCILAVDFKCFPRYLAKTERFGYSLMDTGVGLFVLISGIVHKDLKKDNLKSIVYGNVMLISVLLLLGVVRFWSVKQLDYQEHVTEYGVHWNFFFTLAVCKFLSTFLLFCSNRALLFSVLTIFVHEVLLWYSLQDWVFSDEPRSSLLSANREGISSCLGYVSMYLFTAHLKTELNNKTITRLKLLYKMVLGSIFLWAISQIIHLYRPASRTLANAGYCLYLEAVFLSISTSMYIIEVLFQDPEIKLYFDLPEILRIVNWNGLIYFLVGNLATGMINLSMRTLLVSTTSGIIIFVLYMAFLLIITRCIQSLFKQLKN